MKEPKSPLTRLRGDRTEDRQKKVAALRVEQAARERRRRTVIGGVAATVGLALVVAVGIVIQASRNSTDGPTAVPAGVNADGGYTAGAPDAPVEVAVYEDFQCPACAAFEQQTGPTLADLVDAGDVRVTYYPIAFLDRASTDRYSTRALNAAGCVIDTDPQAFPALHELLFSTQPPEGGPGLSDDQLVSLAVDAGAEDSQVRSCVEDLEFEAWTRQVTDAASRHGINQTPTILVDGQALTSWAPADLRSEVQTAQSNSLG